MPECDACGAHVTPTYKRVRSGNDGKLHGCPSCSSPAVRERECAGVDSLYQVRTDADGNDIPRVVTDGGRNE